MRIVRQTDGRVRDFVGAPQVLRTRTPLLPAGQHPARPAGDSSDCPGITPTALGTRRQHTQIRMK
jgi:hypothetical protein